MTNRAEPAVDPERPRTDDAVRDIETREDLRAQVETLRSEHQAAQARIVQLEHRVRWMESSVFWRLRNPISGIIRRLGIDEAVVWRTWRTEGVTAALRCLTRRKRSAGVQAVLPTPDREIEDFERDERLRYVKDAFSETSASVLDAFLNTGATIPVPSPSHPEVSVVLVLHNQAGLTLHCLLSIVGNGVDSLEIVVADNASTDQTPTLLERFPGVRVIRNAENLHFLRAANQAARTARGKYLLFVNNDAILTPGCIFEALTAMRGDDRIGAVGAKIILPDGKLQEAGCRIAPDGWAYNVGRGADPNDERFSTPRDVDYCSGAFLLTERNLFLGMGGFDEAFAPAYYEDADYCVRLWERDRRVVYVPQVVVRHIEGASSTRKSDVWELVVRNRRIFERKHRAWLGRNAES